MYYRGIFAEPEVKAVRKKLERCCYHLSECSLWRELAWLHPDEIMVVDSLESVVVRGAAVRCPSTIREVKDRCGSSRSSVSSTNVAEV